MNGGSKGGRVSILQHVNQSSQHGGLIKNSIHLSDSLNPMKNTILLAICLSALFLSSCDKKNQQETNQTASDSTAHDSLDIYATVSLTTDLSKLTEDEKAMLPHLIKAAMLMDELFWEQSYGDKNALLSSIQDEKLRRFAEINYGPWNRLDNNNPFIPGVGPKPAGANYYPADMTKEELEAARVVDKKGQYSVIRRDSTGKLYSIPFHVVYKDKLIIAAGHIRTAARLCKDASLKKYLNLRADALLNDQYMASDEAWLDMKTNGIDLIIGPIENYEDHLYNARTAYESYVLIKDKEWSKKLDRYVQFLPELQTNLPCDAAYKKEKINSSNAQLNAYDVVFYAGDCNAGSKTIAVNLPNDEGLQQRKGTRRSQLKNAMRAKYDKILLPIADVLIDESQRKHITFDAFFANTMFHEVAHGLGIKNTINSKGTVRDALEEEFSSLEEGKADILGLYMITSLFNKGEIKEGELMDYYVTFMAGIFRSVRFGGASAHGNANMVRFNYFNEKGAFIRNPHTGKYKVNPEKFALAVNDLSALILKLQGDGDKAGVQKLMAEKGNIGKQLQDDLNRLKNKHIPVDVVFEQGLKTLGLE